jgi:GNAT superfamily N-acetyltransferase
MIVFRHFYHMEIRRIQSGSNEYEQLVNLRVTALLNPIGIPASYIDPEKEKDDLFIGAFEEEDIVGCCVLTKKTESVVQLRQMAVRPDQQGKKIGAAIIAFAEQIAKQQGFALLIMHARDTVIGFYEKCGYQIAGEQFFEVGIGHHKMEKQL